MDTRPRVKKPGKECTPPRTHKPSRSSSGASFQRISLSDGHQVPRTENKSTPSTENENSRMIDDVIRENAMRKAILDDMYGFLHEEETNRECDTHSEEDNLSADGGAAVDEDEYKVSWQPQARHIAPPHATSLMSPSFGEDEDTALQIAIAMSLAEQDGQTTSTSQSSGPSSPGRTQPADISGSTTTTSSYSPPEEATGGPKGTENQAPYHGSVTSLPPVTACSSAIMNNDTTDTFTATEHTSTSANNSNSRTSSSSSSRKPVATFARAGAVSNVRRRDDKPTQSGLLPNSSRTTRKTNGSRGETPRTTFSRRSNSGGSSRNTTTTTTTTSSCPPDESPNTTTTDTSTTTTTTASTSTNNTTRTVNPPERREQQSRLNIVREARQRVLCERAARFNQHADEHALLFQQHLFGAGVFDEVFQRAGNSGIMLPPDLLLGLGMRAQLHGIGEGEMSYEQLVQLEDVKVGLPVQVLNTIPAWKFTKTTTDNPGSQEGRSCPVCLEEFEEGEDVNTLFCTHIFHNECVMEWLQDHKTCPVCKLDMLELHEKQRDFDAVQHE